MTRTNLFGSFGDNAKVRLHKTVYDMAVLLLLLELGLVIRNHYVESVSLKNIMSLMLSYGIMLFFLMFVKKQARANEALKSRKAYQGIMIAIAFLRVFMVIVIVVMFVNMLPEFVSLFGQVIQACFSIPLRMLMHVSSHDLINGTVILAGTMELLACVVIFIALHRLFSFLIARELTRMEIRHESEGITRKEKPTEETDCHVCTSLGYFYHYSAYE